jgi:cytochrome c553
MRLTSMILLSVAMLAGQAQAGEGHVHPKEDIPALIKKYSMPTGKMLGDNCSACHGTLGREFGEAMPPLAGMSKQSFIHIMKAYRDNRSPSIVMHDVAYVYTDEEIEAMADYFAAQEPTQWPSAVQGAK